MLPVLQLVKKCLLDQEVMGNEIEEHVNQNFLICRIFWNILLSCIYDFCLDLWYDYNSNLSHIECFRFYCLNFWFGDLGAWCQMWNIPCPKILCHFMIF